MTATPDRSDGGDLLGLCEENLVYECDLWSGIDRGLLAPFHYFGEPDPVEYSQIPWRSGRFDEAALTEAVATEARADLQNVQVDLGILRIVLVSCCAGSPACGPGPPKTRASGRTQPIKCRD